MSEGSAAPASPSIQLPQGCAATSLQHSTGQDRTGQDRTGQDRTGQDRTGQDSSSSLDQIRQYFRRGIMLTYEVQCAFSEGSSRNSLSCSSAPEPSACCLSFSRHPAGLAACRALSLPHGERPPSISGVVASAHVSCRAVFVLCLCCACAVMDLGRLDCGPAGSLGIRCWAF